jgi:hypothetical protein
MNIQSQFQHIGKELLRIRIVVFLSVLTLLYGFIVWRVADFIRAEPDQQTIDSQSSPAKQPNIDQATVNRNQQLQDNSVNVQTLFDQARQNPFQE